MIGEILGGVLAECKALLSGTGADIILKTNLKALGKDGATYHGNFIMLDFTDAPDSQQYIGSGLTRMDWKFIFNSYNYEPNAMVDDESGYSETLLNFIDMVRQHFTSAFENNGWLTQQMKDIFTNYGFLFTFGGVTTAEAVELDGLVMGYGIEMLSTALDAATLNTVPSSSTLQHVVNNTNVS